MEKMRTRLKINACFMKEKIETAAGDFKDRPTSKAGKLRSVGF